MHTHRSGQSAGADQVARAHVAAGDGVVDQLLVDAPVHVLHVGGGHRVRALHGLGLRGAVQ